MPWYSTPELAIAMGVSRQVAHRAVSRTIPTIGGQPIKIRKVRGKGGKSGWQYEVWGESLPLDLQARLKPVEAASKTSLSLAPAAQRERVLWDNLLGPIVCLPRRSRERSAAIAALAASPPLGTDGKPMIFSLRTIQRQLKDYEDGKHLGRKLRSDKGRARTCVSILFDAAFLAGGGDRAQLVTIGETLKHYIEGLAAKDTMPQMIQTLGGFKLQQLTQASDISITNPEALKLPEVRIKKARNQLKTVARYRRDRKAHEDAKPRIGRTRLGLYGLKPMDMVVGDVHHVNILARREDGSTATPKAILWLDLATNRVWLTLVLLEKGQGIKNVDIIRSLSEMTQAWGMPRRLYLDNGGEYKFAELFKDAMRLVNAGYIEDFGDWRKGRAVLMRAGAYNAPAKPLEGIIHKLNAGFFNIIPGWIGDDRMNKKTANVGKEPEPFPGPFGDLCKAVRAAVELYHMVDHKSGEFKDKSPDRLYGESVAGGWQMTTVDANVLHFAFSTVERRRLTQGCISYDGRRWTSRELQACLDDYVMVRVPRYVEWPKLYLCDDTGQSLIGVLEPDRAYGFTEQAGAVEAKERSNVYKRAILAREKTVPDIDVLKEVSNVVNLRPAQLEAPVAAHISLADNTAELFAQLNEGEDAKLARLRKEGEARSRRTRETSEAIRALLSGGKK